MTSIAEIRAKYPQYDDMSDGDLLMGLHRKSYSDMHPRDFLNSIDGAANAHATIKNPELRKHWVNAVQKPRAGETERETGERLGGTSYGTANSGGRAMAGARSGFQGMTFGYGDEIVGNVASALSGNSPEFETAKERQRLTQGEEEYPVQSALSEVGGALAAPGAAVRSIPGAIAAGTGGGMLYASGKAEEGERTKEAVAAAPASALFSALAVPAQRIASKGLGRLVKGAQKKPSVSNLKRVRDKAYQAVDESGFKFSKEVLDDALSRVYAKLDDPQSAYVKGDPKVERAIKLLEKNWGEDLTLGQLDNVRSRIYKTWAAAPKDEADAIIDIIGVIDDVIEETGGSALLGPAREAHKTFMRVDFLDKEFQKAANNTAVTGSGGNIYNNYARVFKNILNNKTKSRMFTDEQLGFMKSAIDTSAGDDVLRKLGKLSPDGNGLMLALNIIGGSIDPTLFAVGGAGAAAKAVSDRKMAGKIDDILGVAAGQPVKPPQTTPTQVPTAAAVGGLKWDERNR